MLFLHILTSIVSLIVATDMLFRPSRNKISTSYLLLTTTFVSGTYLILTSGANLLKVCAMGIVYFGIIALAIHAAETKLAKESL